MTPGSHKMDRNVYKFRPEIMKESEKLGDIGAVGKMTLKLVLEACF
jgi:hypothetical protein